MRVKRYIVDTMPDAMQQIRSELGKDAVILDKKEIRKGGVLGMFRKKKIEVIAAIDNSAASHSAPQPRTRSTSMNSGVVDGYGARKAYTNQINQKQVNATAPTSHPGNTTDTTVNKMEMAASESKELLDEIKAMKEIVVRLQQNASPNMPTLPEPFERIQKGLLAQEVEPQLVERLLADALDSVEDASQLNMHESVKLMKEQLSKYINGERIAGIQMDTKVVHFVGPTGVGKTTTIAKLAAEQVLTHRRKVGFITSDTYRIAAVEQLKTYASILGVPLEVVFSPLELNRAYSQLQDCDVIFMDTAGRNFRNEMYISELNSLLTSSGKSETYLVLSLATRYRDIKTVTENFSRFKLDKVLFTKGDETDTYGALLNLAMEYPLTFSYITDGQNVPEDISLMDADVWIDRILEVDKDE